MPDDKPPTDPRLASLFSSLRTFGFTVSFLVTLWHYAQTKDLVGAYNFIYSSAALGGIAALFTVVLGIWGPIKRYFDARTIKRQKAALQIATATAPQHVVDAVDATIKGTKP